MFAEKRQMTGQANINAEKLKAMPIALPQVREQIELMGRVRAVRVALDSLGRLHQEASGEVAATFSALLQSAFEG